MVEFGKIYKKNFGNTKVKSNPRKLSRIERQEREYEEKGYFTAGGYGGYKDDGVNRGTRTHFGYSVIRIRRSPYAKGDNETEEQFSRRSKKYTAKQRQQGYEGRFNPDVDL